MESKKHITVVGIASLLMASAIGLNINTMGVYLQPIATSLNVSMGAISTHSMLLTLGLAFGIFPVTPALKRYNIRFIILISALIMALATFAMSFATQIWMFNVLGFIRGFAASFSGNITLQLLINNWFVSKNGLVTSFVFSFSGVAGVLFSPLLANIIEAQGWQTALVLHAGFILLLSAPGFLIPYQLKPEDEGLKPYEAETNESEKIAPKEIGVRISRKPFSIRSFTFIALLSYGFLIPMLTSISQHLAGIGLDFGFSAAIGALMISASQLGNIVFKLVIGALSDTLDAIKAVSLMAGMTVIGFFLLLTAHSTFSVLLGSFLVGTIFSIAAVGLPLLINHLYSPMEFQKIYPLASFAGGMGGAIGVSFYGFSFDLSGGYTLAVILSILVVFVVTVLITWANRASIETEAYKAEKADDIEVQI